MLDETHLLYSSIRHFQRAEVKTHCFRLFSKSQVTPLAFINSANGNFSNKKPQRFTKIALKFQLITVV
jgi:hypothetical protein